MSRLDAESRRLWSAVAATVRPLPGRSAPVVETSLPIAKERPDPTRRAAPLTPRSHIPKPVPPRPPDPIEPNRRRLIVRALPPAEAVLDLHGFDQDRARAALTGFILRAHANGERAVMVITGKGSRGDGVLRRRTPEWLSEPPLRAVVAGLSEAHRRHGGEGALYVALKARRRPLS